MIGHCYWCKYYDETNPKDKVGMCMLHGGRVRAEGTCQGFIPTKGKEIDEKDMKKNKTENGKMKLIDVLMLMEDEEYLPLTMTKTAHGYDLNSIPQSTFKVAICFMCEEETWVTCSTYSAILIPWYDCEVSAINPNDDDTICVWLKDEEYILNNFKHCVNVKEGEKHEID